MAGSLSLQKGKRIFSQRPGAESKFTMEKTMLWTSSLTSHPVSCPGVKGNENTWHANQQNLLTNIFFCWDERGQLPSKNNWFKFMYKKYIYIPCSNHVLKIIFIKSVRLNNTVLFSFIFVLMRVNYFFLILLNLLYMLSAITTFVFNFINTIFDVLFFSSTNYAAKSNKIKYLFLNIIPVERNILIRSFSF